MERLSDRKTKQGEWKSKTGDKNSKLGERLNYRKELKDDVQQELDNYEPNF